MGAHINDINNFLVITGDPIPSVVRASVKSVFNFDSVGLMNIISDMNQEQFAGEPVIYGGAINQGRVNFKVELERVKKKLLGIPVARYDKEKRRAYLEYPDGRKVYEDEQ